MFLKWSSSGICNMKPGNEGENAYRRGAISVRERRTQLLLHMEDKSKYMYFHSICKFQMCMFVICQMSSHENKLEEATNVLIGPLTIKFRVIQSTISQSKLIVPTNEPIF